MPDLPQTNPPVPCDYSYMGATWWNGPGPYVIAPGTSLSFPTEGFFASPPTTGHGFMRNELTFSFDIVEGEVSAVVGVSNVSEHDYPMRPWVGCCYPAPTIPLHAGQRAHLIRVDAIDTSQPPDDLRSWEMNPGLNGGSGRAAYPSLSPEVTNTGSTPAVIQNVQIQAYARQI